MPRQCIKHTVNTWEQSRDITTACNQDTETNIENSSVFKEQYESKTHVQHIEPFKADSEQMSPNDAIKQGSNFHQKLFDVLQMFKRLPVPVAYIAV